LSPQLLRHRSFTFQEFSQRYSDPIQILKNFDEAYKFDLRTKGETNRQSSVEQLPLYLRQHFWEKFEDIDRQIKTVYAEMLELGVAKECARHILPLYTPTRLHMSGTIRSFIHYVGLRGREETQLEHRQIAHSIGYCLKKELPTVINAVKNSEDTSLTGWSSLR